MKKLIPFLGFVLGLGLACSRSIQGEDPEYQKRIDEYAAHHCAMNIECGNEAPPGATYEECFSDLSTQAFWWEGDADCKDSRWEYYDCRARVTSCDVWPVGAGLGHECDAAWNDNFVDCSPKKGGG